MSAPGDRECRHDLRQDTNTVDELVCCRLVRDQPEVWRQRDGPQTGTGIRQLPDGVDDSAQASSCNGPSWTYSTIRCRRSRRVIRWWRRERCKWPGAEVHTDGWGGYNKLSKHGYTHRRTILSSSAEPAHVSMPAVHRVASLLKRWLLGTHQGGVGSKQLNHYLDEFTFRFNRRSSRSRGLLFYRLIEQAVAIKPAPYRAITGGKS